MDIKQFIEKFQGQLEDTSAPVEGSTDYVNSDFWDSLTAMVVKVMIEDEYSVDISVEKINTFATINQLFDFIKSLK